MPIKPKSFFSSKGHSDDRERLFCIDEDNILWVLHTPLVDHPIIPGQQKRAEPAGWYWRRVSLQTENEAKPETKPTPYR